MPMTHDGPMITCQSEPDEVLCKTMATSESLPNDRGWISPKSERICPVLVEGSDEEGYTATTPILPGCIAEGDSIDEALLDFKIAHLELLKAYKEEGKPVPWKKVDGLPLYNPDVRIFLVPSGE